MKFMSGWADGKIASPRSRAAHTLSTIVRYVRFVKLMTFPKQSRARAKLRSYRSSDLQVGSRRHTWPWAGEEMPHAVRHRVAGFPPG